MKNTYLFGFLLLFVLSSCESLLFQEDEASTDPYVNFEYLWTEIDKKYSYFELKNIDWDALKRQYQNQLSDGMAEEELFDVLSDLLAELRDDHTNLIAPFNISRYNLALQKKANYHERTIREFYIPNAKLSGGIIHDFLPGNEVAYIRYSSFMNFIDSDIFDYILNRYQNTKAIIFDIRENGGGSLLEMPKILERFTLDRIQVAQTRTRNGEGRNDFSAPQGIFLNPHDGVVYTKPVYVLIDRGSYSASTFFSLCTKEMPNITLVGDTTGGGGGLPNGGQLPNGWTYRFSITQVLDLNGNNYAEDGVHPDIVASFDWQDLSKDEIIERVLQEL